MMKHIGLISMMACAAFMFAGCSNEFEDVFNGNNKDVIAPVELDGEVGIAWTSIESHGQLQELVSAALVGLGIKLPDDHSLPPELFKKEDYAVVVNDGQPLKGVVGSDGVELSWPDIDFKKYSLVLGWFIAPGSGYRIVNQRFHAKKDKNVLYLEIKPYTEFHLAGFMVEYFAAIYPKQEGNIVEISRWNNY